ncbi:hypothetical protein [Kitasatospora sp. NPDC056181]|uniref:hypothetical protein n=1 Tax=Kitasatospora sp. NPDC056181 TaxID=3345737 RepID=UPI0035DCAC3D
MEKELRALAVPFASAATIHNAFAGARLPKGELVVGLVKVLGPRVHGANPEDLLELERRFRLLWLQAEVEEHAPLRVSRPQEQMWPQRLESRPRICTAPIPPEQLRASNGWALHGELTRTLVPQELRGQEDDVHADGLAEMTERRRAHGDPDNPVLPGLPENVPRQHPRS